MTGLVLLLLAVPLVLVFVVIGIYNGLVAGRNQTDNAWSQIDVHLKRRFDLIPNLVETAKGYMQHERQTFEAITNARSQAMGAKSVGEAARADGALTEAISKFLVVVENYPQLKADQNFLSLQEALTSTENKIAFARQAYNDSVLAYHNKLQMFPSNIVAGMFNFTKREFFEVEDKAQRQNPQVKF